jgi:hypothetical protein
MLRRFFKFGFAPSRTLVCKTSTPHPAIAMWRSRTAGIPGYEPIWQPRRVPWNAVILEFQDEASRDRALEGLRAK